MSVADEHAAFKVQMAQPIVLSGNGPQMRPATVGETLDAQEHCIDALDAALGALEDRLTAVLREEQPLAVALANGNMPMPSDPSLTVPLASRILTHNGRLSQLAARVEALHGRVGL